MARGRGDLVVKDADRRKRDQREGRQRGGRGVLGDFASDQAACRACEQVLENARADGRRSYTARGAPRPLVCAREPRAARISCGARSPWLLVKSPTQLLSEERIARIAAEMPEAARSRCGCRRSTADIVRRRRARRGRGGA